MRRIFLVVAPHSKMPSPPAPVNLTLPQLLPRSRSAYLTQALKPQGRGVPAPEPKNLSGRFFSKQNKSALCALPCLVDLIVMITQLPSLGFRNPSIIGRWVVFCVVLVPAFALTSVTGCAHRQLERNTALAATTVNNIQYRMVLDNIAMMSCEPANLPSHVRLADGTVQISNQAGIGESGGFSLLSGSRFAFEQFGPAASTKISEQWGTDAVEDPIQVFALQSIYRKAFGLEVLEEPNFITAGKKSRQDKAKSDSDSEDESDIDLGSVASVSVNRSSSRRGRSNSEVLPSPHGLRDSDRLNTSRKQSDVNENVSADLDASDFDIPSGWFSIGCKKDVPKDACYVGRFRDRYAWVMPGDVDSLARFTLAVLTITKLESGETNGKSGLMFTP